MAFFVGGRNPVAVGVGAGVVVVVVAVAVAVVVAVVAVVCPEVSKPRSTHPRTC